MNPGKVHWLVLASGIIILTMVLAGCETPFPSLQTPTPQEIPTGWYRVYFTDPLDPAAGKYRGGPDEALAAAIRGARLSVDVAVYDLNLWSLRDALIDAHRRGLKVRVVTESDNLDEPEIQELDEAGIPVLGDRREGLMHHKFAVIDQLEVWSGSMNYTTTDAYLNDNNLVRLRSSRLAEDYTVEFEEMFVDDRFSSSSQRNTPYTTLTVDGNPLEVYFSPEDGTQDRLVELIQDAESCIDFMVYSFTSDQLAEAILERARAGVQVRGVLEEAQYKSNVGTEYDHLRAAGLDVWLDGNPRNMHHKVMIIDGRILVTGSYNFSSNAEETNDENMLILSNPQIVSIFIFEFERVFAMAPK